MHKSDKIIIGVLLSAICISFIGCTDTFQWFLEMIIPFVLIILYVIFASKLRFTITAKLSLVLFLLLHFYAAHYAYFAPLGELALLDVIFGSSRNHFDRILHFSFGLFLLYPLKELYLRFKQKAPLFHSILLILGASAVYEILEWLAAVWLGGGGVNFIGMQGDIWDTHIDMFLAVLGAVFTSVGLWCVTLSKKLLNK